MCMVERLGGIFISAILLLWPLVTSAQQSPGLGLPAMPDLIADWDIDISPDGTGLPAGTGRALAGAGIYQTKCLACHGQNGEGKPNDRLSGGQGSLTSDKPVKTVGSYWPYATTLFDYIRRAMPYSQPQSLSNEETYAVTAYILFLNGIIAENDEINASTLPLVKMPNKDNFILDVDLSGKVRN